MRRQASNPARPAGGIPKGSAYGLVSIAILTGVLPFLVLQSLVPVLKNGLDSWLASLLPVIGASGLVGALVAYGIYSRRPWYFGFVFIYGCIVLTMFGLSFCLGLVVLFGLIAKVSPDLGFINIVNIIGWVMVSPLAWLLFRLLRLKYWQPWTIPEQWEAGDSSPTQPPRTLIMMLANRKK